MNRIVGWFQLNGATFESDMLEKCPFNTPYWIPDHQEIYADRWISFSATQRFITSECRDCLMPYQDPASWVIINADIYLSNRDSLCSLLSAETSLADAKLLLKAYLQWGERCTAYLEGQFSFMIWDPREKKLFAAVHQLPGCSFFYLYEPQRFFLCSNEFSSFSTLCPDLEPNPNCLINYSRDVSSATETSYKRVLKLPAGHQLVVNFNALRVKCYWRLCHQKQAGSNATREEYYEMFRLKFEQAIAACLRSPHPITTHISGGLDSSSVTAQAANILSAKQQTLHAVTAIPRELEGPSRCSNWYYHEMPRVHAVLERYPNIRHYTYIATPSVDLFSQLSRINAYLSQPIRNVNNFDWVFGCYKYILSIGGRVVLTGNAGNATISWKGQSFIYRLLSYCRDRKTYFIKKNLFNRIAPRLQEYLDPRKLMLSTPQASSTYPVQLWFGVRTLDPTRDLNLAVFCYNAPQWVFHTGQQRLQQRLLVRDALAHILPDEIRFNPHRGEQAADWYLQYNTHRLNWLEKLIQLHPETQDLLWRCYDKNNIFELLNASIDIAETPMETINAIRYCVMCCLSAGFYFNELMTVVGSLSEGSCGSTQSWMKDH